MIAIAHEGNPLQGGDEWLQARCGKLTASQVKDIKFLKNGEPTAVYKALMNKILTERLTGMPVETVCTPAMQWGIDHEQDARELYEVITGEMVTCVGLIDHPTIPNLAASPDGLVGKDGLIEIKCPTPLVHFERVSQNLVPDDYKQQMTLQLIVTGRKWCDYVDYDPRFLGPYKNCQIMIKRFEPTDEDKAKLLDKCMNFLSAVDTKLDLIKSFKGAY